MQCSRPQPRALQQPLPVRLLYLNLGWDGGTSIYVQDSGGDLLLICFAVGTVFVVFA